MFEDKSFLYVEDDTMSRQALELILKRVMKAQNVWVFENSVNFIERVEALPVMPDVFLLDIHVPPYTGFEMLAMLRAHPDYADKPIIALTASVMNEEVNLLKNSGFSGAIGKPIVVQYFPSLMQRILSGEAVWHITGV